MNYYNGFCLENEEVLFEEYLNDSKFTICGFSYGAIKAFEKALKSEKRVDELILISPAFFQCEEKRFKKLQTLSFKKDSTSYIDNFLKNCAYPSTTDLKSFFKEGSYEELEELLYFQWSEEQLRSLKRRGCVIRVYLGEEDKIISSKKAYEFFKEFANVYFYKNKGHILQ